VSQADERLRTRIGHNNDEKTAVTPGSREPADEIAFATSRNDAQADLDSSNWLIAKKGGWKNLDQENGSRDGRKQ
jgi:hypothetical protein